MTFLSSYELRNFLNFMLISVEDIEILGCDEANPREYKFVFYITRGRYSASPHMSCRPTVR